MKIERFLVKIQKELLRKPDIDLKTLKLFTQIFGKCLSNKEYERHWISLNIIEEFTLKQISLDTCVHNAKVEVLEKNLQKVKSE